MKNTLNGLTASNITEVLAYIASETREAFSGHGYGLGKWTVKASDLNNAVLVVEPGWPDNKHATAGLASLSVKVGSTGNLLIRVDYFERWLKLNDKNLAKLVAKLVRFAETI